MVLAAAANTLRGERVSERRPGRLQRARTGPRRGTPRRGPCPGPQAIFSARRAGGALWRRRAVPCRALASQRTTGARQRRALRGERRKRARAAQAGRRRPFSSYPVARCAHDTMARALVWALSLSATGCPALHSHRGGTHCSCIQARPSCNGIGASLEAGLPTLPLVSSLSRACKRSCSDSARTLAIAHRRDCATRASTLINLLQHATAHPSLLLLRPASVRAHSEHDCSFSSSELKIWCIEERIERVL